MSSKIELRGAVHLDQMQPQFAATIAANSDGYFPVAGESAFWLEVQPGIVVNRLLVPYMVQALEMLDRGDASKEDIDAAMQLGCGHPMGPITLTDYVGLDTTLFILQGWKERYPDEPAFGVPAILERYVAEGKLGRKVGEGFYSWDGDKKA